MVEEETLKGGLKGGGKEEEEWVSLNTLSLKKTKIWQDYSTSWNSREEKRGDFFCVFGMKEREGLYIYSSGGGNINGKLFNEGWPHFSLGENLVH